MPVYQLLKEMPYDELLKWQEYFKRRPVGWRDDNRTYAFLRTQGVTASPQEIFSSLIPIFSPVPFEEGSPVKGLKESMFYQKMLNAVGGDKLEGMQQ